ncbi:hypothetical protein CHRYSEO8AT_130001 [Chryseobacterium sp. 8AT]|nr:hypothetical protein CHRYSEO8AT_130001 [Chryseobacterium sp. 8AT]
MKIDFLNTFCSARYPHPLKTSVTPKYLDIWRKKKAPRSARDFVFEYEGKESFNTKQKH